ncbi:MAG: phospholipase D-like domain-containing protein [Pseudomonadales bacterium]|nr:phospholipase D-like domain-containing protein [Pseudomonadales bacterium]
MIEEPLSHHPALPWRVNNQFQLLVNGDVFYPEILRAIENAQQSIEIELYLCDSGDIANQFIETLSAASKRGIEVRVLLDAVGSNGFKQRDRQQLRNNGVDLRFYNRFQTKRILHNLARDHRKIVAIDNKIVFVGGAGIADEFFNKDGNAENPSSWRELMVKIQGPIVADWRYLFERVWHQHKGPEGLTHWRDKIYDFTRYYQKQARLITEKPQAHVNASRGMGSEQIKGALVTELRKAKYQAWIATAYFYPSRKLRRAIRRAAKRGVDVRLLLPGPKTDHPSIRYAGRTYYSDLLNDGVKIYEYQPSFMHMKIALVDDWVSVGSCNFDRWNLRWNLEANQEVIDPRLAKQVFDMLVNDFKSSVLYSAESWPERPYFIKLKERFWAYVGVFIEQYLYR